MPLQTQHAQTPYDRRVPPAFPDQRSIERSLAGREHPAPGTAQSEAAVLACLNHEALLLVRRQRDPRDRWSGHIGLPGGRREKGDATLLDTALRETEEELGFDPLAWGRLAGPLGTELARHRRPDDLAIAVFVALLDVRPVLTLSAEIDSAYWVPLAELTVETAWVPEVPEPVPAYRPLVHGERLVVWGITYRILEQLRSLRPA